MHLAGPTAKRVLDAGEGEAVRERELLGLPGFDIIVPNVSAAIVRQRLIENGATPASREVFETLRIEAGTPLFGPDIDVYGGYKSIDPSQPFRYAGVTMCLAFLIGLAVLVPVAGRFGGNAGLQVAV